jgi:hypothetical protein
VVLSAEDGVEWFGAAIAKLAMVLPVLAVLGHRDEIFDGIHFGIPLVEIGLGRKYVHVAHGNIALNKRVLDE